MKVPEKAWDSLLISAIIQNGRREISEMISISPVLLYVGSWLGEGGGGGGGGGAKPVFSCSRNQITISLSLANCGYECEMTKNIEEI